MFFITIVIPSGKNIAIETARNGDLTSGKLRSLFFNSHLIIDSPIKPCDFP